MSKLFGSKDGDAQGENKSETPDKEAANKSVQDYDAEQSAKEVDRQPQPQAAEKESKTGVEVGDAVMFYINDTGLSDGHRKLPAFVVDVLEDDKVNIATFNSFGANFGQVAIEHSEKPRVGRWSWPEDKTDEVLPDKPVQTEEKK